MKSPHLFALLDQRAANGTANETGGTGHQDLQSSHSTMVASPCPTPTHSVASPRNGRGADDARRFISWTSVVRMRAPEHPSGWPRAIAPPLTLVISGSRSSSRMTASA